MTGVDGALAVQILTLGNQISDLQKNVKGMGQLADDVRDLGAELDALRELVEAALPADAEEVPAGMWDWSLMNKDQAAEAWETLIGWVEEVLFGIYNRVTNDRAIDRRGVVLHCWYQHPDVVAELSWLCQEWHRIYRGGKATPAAAGEWHDRWLPGVIRRATETMSRCGPATGHHDPARGTAIADQETLKDTVLADIAKRPTAPKDDDPAP